VIRGPGPLDPANVSIRKDDGGKIAGAELKAGGASIYVARSK
jgi:hypothetical protein